MLCCSALVCVVFFFLSFFFFFFFYCGAAVEIVQDNEVATVTMDNSFIKDFSFCFLKAICS